MSLEAIIELQASIEEANGAIVASNDDLSPSAGTAIDLARDFLGNRAFSGVFLFEEVEFPPLVHLSDQYTDRIYM